MKILKSRTKIEEPNSATALMIIGWLIIIGSFIAGCVLGRSFAAALVYWAVGAIFGTILIGLGKVISLLTLIANKDFEITEEGNLLGNNQN